MEEGEGEGKGGREGGSGAEGIVVVCAHRMVVVVIIPGRRMMGMEVGGAFVSLCFRAASASTAENHRSSTDWDLRAC